MDSCVYGYARVSSKDQCEDRQIILLTEFSVSRSDIFVDKQSGKDFKRPSYERLLSVLKAGDSLIVCSIDRLGRNYEEILEQWRIITKIKRANIVVLDMPLLDTRCKGRDLTGMFVSDLVLQILSYVAQTERENIKKRQRQGIEAAKLRGVRFGAPLKALPQKELCVLRERWLRGEISARAAARALGVSAQTFTRRCAAQPAKE